MYKSKVAGVFVVVVVLLAISWITISAKRTLNPREHIFTDDRLLTEDVAIELTKKALIADGYDVATLMLIDYSPNQVVWRSKSGDADYGVRIDRVDADYHCRVYQHK